MAVDRQAIFVGQGHGVGDRAAFDDGGFVHGQLGDDFVGGVSNSHSPWRGAEHQVLEGFTGHGRGADGQAQGAWVFVDVFALNRRGVDRRGGARQNGDRAAIAQGHVEVVAQRLIDLHGERRADVFNNAAIAFDAHGDPVALARRLIGNGGGQRGFIQRQLFELRAAAGDGLKLVDQCGLTTGVHVIHGVHDQRTAAGVGGDVDGLTVGQREGHGVVAVDRQAIFVGQGHGIGDRAAFDDGGFVHG